MNGRFHLEKEQANNVHLPTHGNLGVRKTYFHILNSFS
jgi:hypothetical protein